MRLIRIVDGMVRAKYRRLIVAAFPLFPAAALHWAHADLQVRLPTVEYRELEFEHNGFFSFDKDRSLGGQQSYTNSISYGVTPWWQVELEAETNSVPDTSVHYTATTMENTFQITEPGQVHVRPRCLCRVLTISVTQRTE